MYHTESMSVVPWGMVWQSDTQVPGRLGGTYFSNKSKWRYGRGKSSTAAVMLPKYIIMSQSSRNHIYGHRKSPLDGVIPPQLCAKSFEKSLYLQNKD